MDGLATLGLTLQNHICSFPLCLVPGKTDLYRVALLCFLTLWLPVGSGQQKTMSGEDGEKEKPAMAPIPFAGPHSPSSATAPLQQPCPQLHSSNCSFLLSLWTEGW